LREIDLIITFIREAWKEAGPGALGWSGATQEDIDEISSPTFLRELAQDPEADFFVAKDRRKVVGMAVNRVRSADEAELSGIIVMQKLVGRGIGSGLLRRVEEAAVARGAGRLTVKTEVENLRALAFYVGKGFKKGGESLERVGKIEIRTVVLHKEL
jgi:ribosomal protein S18 acetylase RimI-like enzyme